jgi:sigma-B regulation protein RsbU (phosphoserine phosphatase)
MKILIAEDDATSRSLLTMLVAKRGHEPVVTVNGTEALFGMQQPDAPSLAILDWMMPELDGIDVCRRIRELATDRPPYIIMLTTKGETADIVAGLVAGADDYLTKPFDANELYARIDVGRRLLDLQTVLAGKVEELRDALAQIKTLRGTVPICACCKKIRDDKGYWNQVEVYVRDHTEAQFSHGICPECSAKLYPE